MRTRVSMYAVVCALLLVAAPAFAQSPGGGPAGAGRGGGPPVIINSATITTSASGSILVITGVNFGVEWVLTFGGTAVAVSGNAAGTTLTASITPPSPGTYWFVVTRVNPTWGTATGSVTVETSLTPLTARVTAAESAATVLTGRVANAEGNIAGLSTSTDTRFAAAAGATSALASSTSAALTTLSTRVTNAEGRVLGAEGRLTGAEGRLTTVEGLGGDNVLQIAGLTSGVQGLQTGAALTATTLSNHGTRLSALEGLVEWLHSQVTALAGLTTRVTSVESRLGTLESEVFPPPPPPPPVPQVRLLTMQDSNGSGFIISEDGSFSQPFGFNPVGGWQKGVVAAGKLFLATNPQVNAIGVFDLSVFPYQEVASLSPPTPGGVFSLGVSTDGASVYAGHQTGFSVIDAATLQVTREITMGKVVAFVPVSASRVLVSTFENFSIPQIVDIDPMTGVVAASWYVPTPHVFDFTVQGGNVYYVPKSGWDMLIGPVGEQPSTVVSLEPGWYTLKTAISANAAGTHITLVQVVIDGALTQQTRISRYEIAAGTVTRVSTIEAPYGFSDYYVAPDKSAIFFGDEAGQAWKVDLATGALSSFYMFGGGYLNVFYTVLIAP